MYGRQQYGNIIPGLVGQLAGEDVAHVLFTTRYCAFTVQDWTGVVGGGTAFDRRYVPLGATRTTHSVRVVDPTNLGPTPYTVLVCAQHSKFDIGPIMEGTIGNPTANRLAALGGFENRGGIKPSYRSLHRGVRVNCRNGQAPDLTTVIHGLGTTDVVVFIQPDEDPLDPGAGVSPIAFWAVPVDANTIAISAEREIGGGFAAVVNQRVACDVMVLAYRGPARRVGHSAFLIGGGDYAVANAHPSTTHRGSYGVAYFNVDGVPAFPGLIIEHNLLQQAQMVLLGCSTFPGTSTPLVLERAATGLGISGTRQSRIASVGGAALNNLYALCFREYTTFKVALPAPGP